MLDVTLAAEQRVVFGMDLHHRLAAVDVSEPVSTGGKAELLVGRVDPDLPRRENIVEGKGRIVIPHPRAGVSIGQHGPIHGGQFDRLHLRHDFAQLAGHEPTHPQAAQKLTDRIQRSVLVLIFESTSRVPAGEPQPDRVLSIVRLQSRRELRRNPLAFDARSKRKAPLHVGLGGGRFVPSRLGCLVAAPLGQIRRRNEVEVIPQQHQPVRPGNHPERSVFQILVGHAQLVRRRALPDVDFDRQARLRARHDRQPRPAHRLDVAMQFQSGQSRHPRAILRRDHDLRHAACLDRRATSQQRGAVGATRKGGR